MYFLKQNSTCFGLSVHHQESRTVHTASGTCHTGSAQNLYGMMYVYVQF